MTSNYQELIDICKKRFGGLGAFSYIKYGNANVIGGYNRMSDTPENRIKIEKLILDAVNFPEKDINKYVISEADIKRIRDKMKVLVDQENKTYRRKKYKNPDWLEDNDVDDFYYRSVVSPTGNSRIKNASYQDLIDKLGITV